MSVTNRALPQEDAQVADRDAGATERIAWRTFAGLEAGALVFFLVAGRHLWFAGDEWDFLAVRGLNPHDLLAQHGGHLVALPLVIFRALFNVFGLHTYLPYQVVAVVAHLAVAWMLRAVIRRAGVRPWIATAGASLFLFFGAGAVNILTAFQIAFTGAIAFGFGQLLLADHDGALNRRDWLGLAAGLGAIMCSGVGLTMLIVVGVAALIAAGGERPPSTRRRSWGSCCSGESITPHTPRQR